jgi:hypothetical protein
MRWTITILVAFFAGCHKSPQAYTLVRQERNLLLTPPPSKPDIKNARRHPARKNGCDIESASFSVTWRGNRAHVEAKPEAYYAPPESPKAQSGTAAITIAESGPRMFSDALAQLDAFRDAIAAKEDAGCLRGDEGAHLSQAITETFAFPPQIAAYLRFGAWTRTGVIELTPGFLLRLVTFAGGTPNVSLYSVVRAPDGLRVRIALVSGEGGGLEIPATPGFYRYLYRTGASAHNFLATILGSTERDVLTEATRQFQADPDGYCDKPSAGVFCQGVKVGVNAGFNVRVNGQQVFARMGGGLSEAVSETNAGVIGMGRPRAVPHVQSVRRLYHGQLIPIQFDTASNEILGLILMPGDEIRVE